MSLPFPVKSLMFAFSCLLLFSNKALPEINPDLAAPVLITPQNNATEIATDTILKWTHVDVNISNATVKIYYVQLDTTEKFLSPMDLDPVDDTIMSISGLAKGTSYYWRVQVAYFLAGTYGTTEGPWSETGKFTTGGPASRVVDHMIFSNDRLSGKLLKNGIATVQLINLMGKSLKNYTLIQNGRPDFVTGKKFINGEHLLLIKNGQKTSGNKVYSVK